VTVQLDHTIVPCRDKHASAEFLAEVLGLPAPVAMGHFQVVALSDGLTLDFPDADGQVRPGHYAFAVGAAEFEAILGRVTGRGLQIWADPQRRRPGEVAERGAGQGFYFEEPSGHYLEVLTRDRREARVA
jgi:catechol 2,3-dioxygenase-like lactoylglutathione lyase family enzyme